MSDIKIDNLLSLASDSPMTKAAKLVELQALKKEIEPQILQLRQELLEITKGLDVLSLKTGSYTISRVKKPLPHVDNVAQLKASLDMANIPYEIVETFDERMGLVFRQLAKEGRDMPGLSYKESEYIMVRITEDKK